MEEYLDIVFAGATFIGFTAVGIRQAWRNLRSDCRTGQAVDGTYWGAYAPKRQPQHRPTVNLPKLAASDRDFGNSAPSVFH